MREILFKAKRKNWLELPKEQWWVKGYLVKKKCGRYTTIGYEEYEAYVIVSEFSDGGMQFCYIDEDTICQYTGLTDKNGNKIWENDIVQICDFTVEYYVVAFEEEKAMFELQQYSSSMMNFEDESRLDMEVIGNIFDNTELLEGGAV